MKTLMAFLGIALMTSTTFANEDSKAVIDFKMGGLSAYSCQATGHSPQNSKKLVRKNGKQVFAKSEAEAYQLCLIKLDITFGYGPKTNELFAYDAFNRLMIIDTVDLLKLELP